jgi:hypothetical protein
MKKLILFLILALLQSKEVISNEIIFDEPVYKISKFFGVEKINSNQKDLYVQIGYQNTNAVNDSYKIYKYNSTTNSWYNPYNNFFDPSWYYHTKWNYWIVNPVSFLLTSDVDTNAVIKYINFLDIDYYFDVIKITHNSGSSSHTGNVEGYHGGFDIDSVENYSPHFSIVNYYISSHNPPNSKIYYVTSMEGNILNAEIRSTIYGLKHIMDGGMLKVNPFKRNNIFINADNLMLSINSGYNFFSVNIPPVKRVLFATENMIYAYTDTQLYKSINSGISFESLSIPSNVNMIEIDPDDPNRLYAGTDHGLYISYNGGMDWSLYFNAFISSQDVKGISKNKNSGDTLFVANDYSVYKIWNSLLNVNQNSSIVNDFKLFQNYPNPFNPVTNIKFSLPSSQYTILKVFDIAGREVATLVNEKLQAGNYEFTFDADGLSSGVYFYQLRADEFVKTRKMVLTK